MKRTLNLKSFYLICHLCFLITFIQVIFTNTVSKYLYLKNNVQRPYIQKDESLIFANGSFKLAAEREQTKRKMKWHSVPNFVAHFPHIPTR